VRARFCGREFQVFFWQPSLGGPGSNPGLPKTNRRRSPQLPSPFIPTQPRRRFKRAAQLRRASSVGFFWGAQPGRPSSNPKLPKRNITRSPQLSGPFRPRQPRRRFKRAAQLRRASSVSFFGSRAWPAKLKPHTPKTRQNSLSTAIQPVKIDSAPGDDFKGLLSSGE
jgi:hypothetical protein